MESRIAAIDFESYYHTKNCSIRVQGTRGYIEHPEFDAYMVSIATSDGGTFVGHPSDFDFHELADYPIWLSHNKGFDQTLYQLVRAKGKIVGPDPHRWHCTADLAAYLGFPRDLAGLLEYLYEVKLDKSVRDRMSGRKWESLLPDEKEEVRAYALGDVEYLIRFWNEYSPQWPESERVISDLTLVMKNRGLPIDAVKLDESVRQLQQTMFDAEAQIPWFDSNDPKGGKTPLSPKALAAECRKLGLPVLSSRAKGSAEAEEWIATHGEKAPFVQAMRDWNSANSLLKKLLVLRERIVFPEENDPFYQDLDPSVRSGAQAWVPYGMKYCGAHTGRDTASDGLNVLNMHKGEVFGVDFRSHISAPPGYAFISADYSQIEPRILAYFAGDTEFLDAIRGGLDPYVAFGLKTLGLQSEYDKEKPEDQKSRQLWKMMLLLLGYKGWADTFKTQAYVMSRGEVDVTREEAVRICKLYRNKNKKVVKFWELLEKEMRKESLSTGGSGTYCINFPSGRHLEYREVTGRTKLVYTSVEKKGARVDTHQGKLAENAVQGFARDVFFDGYLRAEAAGIPIILRIYDEFLALVREEEAEEKRALLEHIMCQSPEWAPDLPIAAEAEIITAYKK